TAPLRRPALAVRPAVLSCCTPFRVLCEIGKLAAQRLQRPMQMALHGALRFLHQCRRLAHAETLQMHQYKSFLLAATELRQRLGNAAPEQGIASCRRRGLWCPAVPEGTPRLAHRTPAAVAVRLTHHNLVEPRRQTRLLPEAVKGPIGLEERFLGHILCGRIVTANESPC